MPLPFKKSREMSLGVEIELQIIDAATKDLAPGSPLIFRELGGEQEHIKSELVQAMIEISTGICSNVSQVREDIQKQFSTVSKICDRLRFNLASAGSHPFAKYEDRIIYPSDRYRYLIDRVKWIARRLMIFGVHVHVGMRDEHHAMAMMNAMLHYLPHLLGLSASSPYWQGSDTGLASSRVTIFEALPTAGHPCTFDKYEDFERFYDAMILSKSISSIKDLWWDIRPHPDYGTVEIRVCDGLATLEETPSIVAFAQSLFRLFDIQFRDGKKFRPPSYWILRENKWKASRYGLEADIILDEKGRTSNLCKEIESLLIQLEPLAKELGCSQELNGVHRILENGGSHVRQRKNFESHGSLTALTELLIEEFRQGEPIYTK